MSGRTRSELSNGVQLADLLAYNVYRAFKDENFAYPYFEMLLQHFYCQDGGRIIDGLKVWPEPSPLIALARTAGAAFRKAAANGGGQ